MNNDFTKNLLTSSILVVLLTSSYAITEKLAILEDQYTNTIQSQFEAISDLQDQLDTFGELTMVQPKNRAIVVAIAMTESNCDHNVVHPDAQTKGIGGIKQHLWSTKHSVNSLMAIEEVILTLKDKYPNESAYNIIRRYKGGVTNLKSTDKAYSIYTMLKSLF